MRKLVLRSEGSFHQLYQSWLTKYRNKKETISLIQIFFLLLGIFACFLVFLIYVNKASTQGYFLRDANSTLNHITEQYETIKPKIMNLEEQNMNISAREEYKNSLSSSIATTLSKNFYKDLAHKLENRNDYLRILSYLKNLFEIRKNIT